MYKWFVYTCDIEKYLKVTPAYLNNLISPPQKWEEIIIGELSFKVPISTFKKISGCENLIYFVSESGTIVIHNIAPSKDLLGIIQEKNLKYPIISYQDRLAILKSLPSDISIFHSRSKNQQSYVNQILKPMSFPGGGLIEINIVDPKILKAICIKSEQGDKKGFSAFVDIYSQNEAMSFSVMVKNYEDKRALDTDLLRILGSIKVPDHPLNIETVKKDINAIIDKYNKT